MKCVLLFQKKKGECSPRASNLQRTPSLKSIERIRQSKSIIWMSSWIPSMRNAIALALLVAVTCSLTWAVCIEGHVPIKKEFSRSLYVMTARVIATQSVSDSQDGYFLDGVNSTLQPIEILKGHPPAAVTVFSENSSGRFDLKPSKSYLVFIYREHGRVRVDSCGNSGLLDDSKQTLATTRKLMRQLAK
jgi:hypothetical protein